MPTLKALQVLELYLCLDRAEKEKFDADFKQMQLPAQVLRPMGQAEIKKTEKAEKLRRDLIAYFERAQRRNAAKNKK